MKGRGERSIQSFFFKNKCCVRWSAGELLFLIHLLKTITSNSNSISFCFFVLIARDIVVSS